jgi:hypothetical protein
MNHDAIDALAGWGYSEREAAFLYMVAVHSGYFLRRHFNQFVIRERGAIATHFLRRAVRLGHVAEMPCADGRMLYQIRDKRVYDVAGNGNSQGRRVKSPGEVLRRLVALDYVLLHLGRERFVETEEARRQLFMQLKVPQEVVKRAGAFGRTVPVSLIETVEPPTVRFAYFDEGQRSTAMFARFLRIHAEVFRALPCAEVAYVSVSPAQFHDAHRLFTRLMPLKNSARSACPLGVEHLIRWLDIRHRCYHGHDSICSADHQFLLQGESIYRAPVHVGLIASWSNGAMNANKIRALFREEHHLVSLVTELLKANYSRSLNSVPGYSPGYGDLQKCLFEKDLELEEQDTPGH